MGRAGRYCLSHEKLVLSFKYSLANVRGEEKGQKESEITICMLQLFMFCLPNPIIPLLAAFTL